MARTYIKTATIDAERYHAGQEGMTPPFMDALCYKPFEECMAGFPHIHTLEGPHTVDDGDWIARGIEGEFWPIKDNIFRKTYKPVASVGPASSSEVSE